MIKLPNSFIKNICFEECMDYKLLFYFIWCRKKNEDYITIPLKEIRRNVLHYNSGNSKQLIIKAIERCIKAGVLTRYYENGEPDYSYTVLSKVKYDLPNITVYFSSDFIYNLNNLKSNYTRVDIEEVFELSTKYCIWAYLQFLSIVSNRDEISYTFKIILKGDEKALEHKGIFLFFDPKEERKTNFLDNRIRIPIKMINEISTLMQIDPP